MTVKELHKKLKEYIRRGYGDKPIYLYNGTVYEVSRVENYLLDEFNSLKINKGDSILMIK